MLKYISLLLLVMIPCLLFGQEEPTKSKNESYRKVRKRNAQEQIFGLHEGVLLVRLKTKQPTIDALKERGQAERAAKIQADQLVYNQNLVKAFKQYFDFCPVYFFYSNYTKHIKSGKLDSVVFLNEQLAPDMSIRLKDIYYLTTEIGPVVGDTAKYFDGYYYEPSPNGPKKQASYYGGNNLGFDALVIKSNLFIQLSKPFPYYERSLRKSMPTIVSGMNAQLHQFYRRKTKQKERKDKRKAKKQ